MTGTVAPLQTYLAAVQSLLVAVPASQPFVPEGPLFAALQSLEGSLGPSAIPQMPGHRLAELHDLIGRLAPFAHRGRVSSLAVQLFLEDLWRRGFLPEGEGPYDPSRLLQGLVGSEPSDPSEGMEAGAQTVFRGTIRMGTVLMAAALAVHPETVSEGAPPPDDPGPLLERPQVPLTDPRTGRLLVTGTVLDGEGTSERTILSDYRIDRQIGRGGNSTVYLGYEIGTNRPVAVKVVTIQDPNRREAFLKGFQNERELQGALVSDRFVHVYTTGRTAEGSPFIVMEFLGRGALGDLIEGMNRGGVPFQLPSVVTLASQVVAAVAEAHRKGVIHRDVKPENFFLTDQGAAKLGDFGISERLAAGSSESPAAFQGTPGYVPPESFPGKNRPAGPDNLRRDVFALGVTLYELLTGQFPFSANTALAVVVRSASEDPPPPSKVRPDRQIPRALDQVVMRAMARDPKKRYADAEELLFDLVSYKARTLEEEGEAVLRSSSGSPVEARVLRHQWRERIEGALREYQRLYEEYPSDPIRQKIVHLHSLLYRWADQTGDDEAVRRNAEGIGSLAPKSQEALEASRPIEVQFYLDGTLPPGSQPEFRLVRLVNRGGLIALDKTWAPLDKPPTARLPRGFLYSLLFSGPGVVPIFIPLPVRPGDYSIRIPVYGTSQVPSNFVVVPAGPVAARERPGSYSERFGNWRTVDHDFAVGPLITNSLWMAYLSGLPKQIGAEEARKRLPRHWQANGKGVYRYADGGAIDPDGPVTHISYRDTIEFLSHLSAQLGIALQLPTLDEWKRTLRGNDPRQWPWGDATPDIGISGFRYPDPRAAGAVVALPNNAPGIRDISPFSIPPTLIPGRQVTHVAGNVQKFLSLGTGGERRRIAKALGMTVEDLTRDRILVAGASYDGPAPTNLDILRVLLFTEVGPIGIMPVVELRPAEPTPSVKSLVG